MATKMTHSGSLGLCHSILVSDEFIAHAKTLSALASEAKKELQDSCYSYYDALIKADKKEQMSLDAAYAAIDSIEQWREEQVKKVDNLVSSRDTSSLEKMISDIKSRKIAPGKDIRMTTYKSNPVSTNKKYYRNSSRAVSSTFDSVYRKYNHY